MSATSSEEWRWVTGYEGLYQVSSLGRLASYRVWGSHKPIRNAPQALLRGSVQAGYVYFRLWKNLACRKRYLHDLVLEAFVGPCPPGQQARHLDGNPGSNALENLTWGTQAENERDKIRHGRYYVGSRANPERRAEILRRLRAGESQHAIARDLKTHQGTIANIWKKAGRV